MDVLQSFLLGLLQGISEFLPISSSGHLVLGKYILGADVETGITYEVVVHFGTLCSILIYYRHTLTDLLFSGLKFLKSPAKQKNDPQVKTIGYILITMIPAMIVGFTIKDQIENIFMDPIYVSIMLIVTGTILFLTRFAGETLKSINLPKSIVIGLAQAFALIPGISRSGSTISASLYLGVKREEAANFSFLMVIPVIAGAMLLEIKDMIAIGISDAEMLSLVVGFFTSFISGYFALKYLIIILKNKGFHFFSYYCWLVGAIGLLYFWLW